MATAKEHPRRRRWARQVSAVILSMLSFFVLFAIDHAGDDGIAPDDFRAPLYRRILSSGFWYQFSVTGCGVKRPENRHVALVLIQGPKILSNACRQRMFLSDLLPTLQQDANARVIVIDERFSPERCSPEADSTRELENAAQHARAKIVYGRDSDRAIDLPPLELDELGKKGLDKNDVILKDTALREAPPHLTWGLVRLSDDSRKIPLGWPGFSSKRSIGLEPRQYKDSLAVAAVKANDPRDRFIE